MWSGFGHHLIWCFQANCYSRRQNKPSFRTTALGVIVTILAPVARLDPTPRWQSTPHRSSEAITVVLTATPNSKDTALGSKSRGAPKAMITTLPTLFWPWIRPRSRPLADASVFHFVQIKLHRDKVRSQWKAIVPKSVFQTRSGSSSRRLHQQG